MEVADAENEELMKYLIHIGAKLNDIFSHFKRRGCNEEGTLLILSALIRRKEIFRDNEGRLYLTREPDEFSPDIVATVMAKSVRMFSRRF